MIDTAKAAKALSQGKVEKTIAILGPKMLSEIYNFDIVDSELQDDKENKTTFLIVKRG
jgi:prephenate dehydratase